jgi:hypothetical protein
VALAPLVGAGAVLVLHVAQGARTTYDLLHGRWHGAADDAARRLSCLEQQVVAAVPARSRVSVDPALGDELWQRTLEIAWTRAVPVPPGEPADLTLTAPAGNTADACAGTVVVAQPGPLPHTTPTAPTAVPMPRSR